jgi:hypothetical protein
MLSAMRKSRTVVGSGTTIITTMKTTPTGTANRLRRLTRSAPPRHEPQSSVGTPSRGVPSWHGCYRPVAGAPERFAAPRPELELFGQVLITALPWVQGIPDRT